MLDHYMAGYFLGQMSSLWSLLIGVYVWKAIINYRNNKKEFSTHIYTRSLLRSFLGDLCRSNLFWCRASYRIWYGRFDKSDFSMHASPIGILRLLFR